MTLAELERRHTLKVLEQEAGDCPRAAQVLGIHASTLRRKLGRWARSGAITSIPVGRTVIDWVPVAAERHKRTA